MDRPIPGSPLPVGWFLIPSGLNAEGIELWAEVEAMLATIEQGLYDMLKRGKAMGELRVDIECPRVARLLQTLIIGLRAFAEPNVPGAQVEVLADDMVGLLDSYRAGRRVFNQTDNSV